MNGYILSEDADLDLDDIFFPVGAYLIVYRAIRPTVEIVAVTQGARDIPSFLHRRFSR